MGRSSPSFVDVLHAGRQREASNLREPPGGLGRGLHHLIASVHAASVTEVLGVKDPNRWIMVDLLAGPNSPKWFLCME